MMQTKIFAHLAHFSESVQLAVVQRDPDTGELWSGTLTLARKPEGVDPTPFATIKREEAQALMDGLWQCGLRPSEGSGSAGAMAATQRHLEDMRTLVFSPTRVGSHMPPQSGQRHAGEPPELLPDVRKTT